jgi:predicted AlkP superfamily pyrophosphatase or phosphodiesterase
MFLYFRILILCATVSWHLTAFNFWNSKDKIKNHKQRLLLVSFDGFRHDYIQRYNLKNFKSFLNNEGASKASYLNPQFSTQTFVNHWSIVTGTYAETHGIISNNFYDPVHKQSFNSREATINDIKWWSATEPIWSTAVKHKIKTGTYFWPGSEVPFISHTNLGKKFFKTVQYARNVSFKKKADTIIDWFMKENFTFVSLYHSEPDSTGHKYGLNSIEFNSTIREVDHSFGYLIRKLKYSKLYQNNENDDITLLIVSDHGMVNIDRHVFLDDFYEDKVDGEIWSKTSSLIQINPFIDRNLLIEKLKKMPNVTVTFKEELPNYIYYKNNRRVGDILIQAHEGAAILHIGTEKVTNDQEKSREIMLNQSEKATHGYDKLLPNMRGVFLARGPMIKKKFYLRHGIENIDIYPLICHILSMKCERRNGSFERIRAFLKNDSSKTSLSQLFLFTNFVAVCFFRSFKVS